MSIKDILKTAAPWISAAIGGPFGVVAVDAIGAALGLSEKTESAIKSALSGATPEILAAMKKADQEFEFKMRMSGYEHHQKLAALAVENTNSARQMQISVKSYLPPILAIIITLGFLGICVGMMSGVLVIKDNQALLVMLGALGTGWGNVLNFYFGSTAESGRKTEMIAQAEAIKP